MPTVVSPGMANTWDAWEAVLAAKPDRLRSLVPDGDALPAPAGTHGSSWVTALADGAYADARARRHAPKLCSEMERTDPARRLEVLAWLVERGQAIDGADDAGRSALELAAVGDTGLMEALLELGLDPSASNPTARKSGRTPLFAAAEAGKLASVEALLAAGADPSIPDGHGRTAAVAAYREEHDGIVVLLAARARASTPQRRGCCTRRSCGETRRSWSGASRQAPFRCTSTSRRPFGAAGSTPRPSRSRPSTGASRSSGG